MCALQVAPRAPTALPRPNAATSSTVHPRLLWHSAAAGLAGATAANAVGQQPAAAGESPPPPPVMAGAQRQGAPSSLLRHCTLCAPRTLITLRISRFSYRWPDFLLTTGCSGTVPLTASAWRGLILETRGRRRGRGAVFPPSKPARTHCCTASRRGRSDGRSLVRGSRYCAARRCVGRSGASGVRDGAVAARRGTGARPSWCS